MVIIRRHSVATLSILLLALTACKPQAVKEHKQTDRLGQSLNLPASIRAYLGGDEESVAITWNLAQDYRLCIDAITVSDESGLLASMPVRGAKQFVNQLQNRPVRMPTVLFDVYRLKGEFEKLLIAVGRDVTEAR